MPTHSMIAVLKMVMSTTLPIAILLVLSTKLKNTQLQPKLQSYSIIYVILEYVAIEYKQGVFVTTILV